MNFYWSELSSVWIDLLYFGYYLLYTVYDSTREWIYCILDIVHILVQTVQLCKLSEYLYTVILCDWISKGSQDKGILLWNIEQITGYRYPCVSGHWTDHRIDHRTDCWIQWINLTVTVVRSDRFHYCIIVCTIESIPVGCNHYFNC